MQVPRLESPPIGMPDAIFVKSFGARSYRTGERKRAITVHSEREPSSSLSSPSRSRFAFDRSSLSLVHSLPPLLPHLRDAARPSKNSTLRPPPNRPTHLDRRPRHTNRCPPTGPSVVQLSIRPSLIAAARRRGGGRLVAPVHSPASAEDTEATDCRRPFRIPARVGTLDGRLRQSARVAQYSSTLSTRNVGILSIVACREKSIDGGRVFDSFT